MRELPFRYQVITGMGSPSALHLNVAELYSSTVDEVGDDAILGGDTDSPVSPEERRHLQLIML